LSGEHLRAWVGRPALQLVADHAQQMSRAGANVIVSPYLSHNAPQEGLSKTQK
jgi:hypothetical protein